jgi:holo-[acyl-carrier protein] synthase
MPASLTTGTDILYIPRIEEALVNHGERFLKRVYTSQELSYCRNRIPELAARFAAKEAISKALGVGMRIMAKEGIYWHDAEVVNDHLGKPLVKLHGKALLRAQALGLTQWSISLTHEKDYAVAFVVAM